MPPDKKGHKPVMNKPVHRSNSEDISCLKETIQRAVSLIDSTVNQLTSLRFLFQNLDNKLVEISSRIESVENKSDFEEEIPVSSVFSETNCTNEKTKISGSRKHQLLKDLKGSRASQANRDGSRTLNKIGMKASVLAITRKCKSSDSDAESSSNSSSDAQILPSNSPDKTTHANSSTPNFFKRPGPKSKTMLPFLKPSRDSSQRPPVSNQLEKREQSSSSGEKSSSTSSLVSFVSNVSSTAASEWKYNTDQSLLAFSNYHGGNGPGKEIIYPYEGKYLTVTVGNVECLLSNGKFNVRKRKKELDDFDLLTCPRQKKALLKDEKTGMKKILEQKKALLKNEKIVVKKILEQRKADIFGLFRKFKDNTDAVTKQTTPPKPTKRRRSSSASSRSTSSNGHEKEKIEPPPQPKRKTKAERTQPKPKVEAVMKALEKTSDDGVNVKSKLMNTFKTFQKNNCSEVNKTEYASCETNSTTHQDSHDNYSSLFSKGDSSKAENSDPRAMSVGKDNSPEKKDDTLKISPVITFDSFRDESPPKNPFCATELYENLRKSLSKSNSVGHDKNTFTEHESRDKEEEPADEIARIVASINDQLKDSASD